MLIIYNVVHCEERKRCPDYRRYVAVVRGPVYWREPTARATPTILVFAPGFEEPLNRLIEGAF